MRQSRSAEIRDELINNAEKIHRRVMATYNKMSPLQRVIAFVLMLAAGVTGLLFLIFNERIFGFLEPYAEKWKHTTGGWTILWALTFLTAWHMLMTLARCGHAPHRDRPDAVLPAIAAFVDAITAEA